VKNSQILPEVVFLAFELFLAKRRSQPKGKALNKILITVYLCENLKELVERVDSRLSAGHTKLLWKMVRMLWSLQN